MFIALFFGFALQVYRSIISVEFMLFNMICCTHTFSLFEYVHCMQMLSLFINKNRSAKSANHFVEKSIFLYILMSKYKMFTLFCCAFFVRLSLLNLKSMSKIGIFTHARHICVHNNSNNDNILIKTVIRWKSFLDEVRLEWFQIFFSRFLFYLPRSNAWKRATNVREK